MHGAGAVNRVFWAKSPGTRLLWRDWEACMQLADTGLQQYSWGEVDSDDTIQDVHLNHFLPKQPFMAQIR